MAQVENATKTGYLERKVGKKKGRIFWYILMGSTLFEYKDINAGVPKKTFQIKGFELSLQDKGFSISLLKDGKECMKLVGTGKADINSWYEVLLESQTKEAEEAPVLEEKAKVKGSAVNRAVKNMGGKIVVSNVAKNAIKNVINEETKLLLVALKKIICKVENAKKAEEIETNIMKILTKAYFLDRDKLINTDDFDQVDEPLRETFEILVFMRDYRERLKPSTVEEKFRIVQKNLKIIEEIISNILINRLSGKSIHKLGTIFGLLSSIDFLNEAWSDETIDDERNLLADAMNRYTQFH